MPPKPVVASYCVTFLAPEMLHVYRQIRGLQEFQPVVLTEKWIHRDRFPFDPSLVEVIPRARLRALRKLWYKQVTRRPIPASARQVQTIERVLRQREARVLHVYFGHIGLYLLPLLRKRLLPTVVSFHGADAGVDHHQPQHRAALLELFQVADRLLVRSEALATELRKAGCPEAKLRLNRTGIPLEDWPSVAREVPADGAWRLLQACRLIEKKGLDLSLRAFARLHRDYPAARLVIAGEGPLQTGLEALARELGIQDAVAFRGFLDEAGLRAEMQRAHLFLHPSRTGSDGNQEGVPNSMLEAMATGLPVLATHHGGIPEAVTDGVSGLLVPENDGPALTAALRRLIDDPDLARRLGTAGCASVRETFSSAARVADLERIYAEVGSRWKAG
ncbi:MAG: glycosyltransferase [Verrucomicrobia bacterium]|nr:glycosyltransferase [Verrucomicrobiota bacterium]